MSTVTLPGGETIWFKKTETGASILHIHGSAFGYRNFEKLTPHMESAFEVIDFDLPGYGQSTGTPRPGGMEGIAEQVYEFIGTIGHERLHVHGTSFGAMVALALAARHPEVIDRLVLSCFLARWDLAARMMRHTWMRAARDSGMDAVADLTSVAGFARSFYERPEADAQLASMREAFSHTSPDAFIAGTETAGKTDLSPLIKDIVAPTLLLAGDEDNMTPFELAPSGVGMAQVQDQLSDCETHILNKCGHYLVIEQPEEAARLITAFLQKNK